jgi:hypothetical protein
VGDLAGDEGDPGVRGLLVGAGGPSAGADAVGADDEISADDRAVARGDLPARAVGFDGGRGTAPLDDVGG